MQGASAVISNYPDGISPSDPRMPWNQPPVPEWREHYTDVRDDLLDQRTLATWPDTVEDAASELRSMAERALEEADLMEGLFGD